MVYDRAGSGLYIIFVERQPADIKTGTVILQFPEVLMKRLFVVLFLLCFMAVAAPADVIIFKDGTHLECKVTGIVNNQAGVQESGREYYIPMEKISEIIYVKKVKEDDTMKWVITGSAILMSLLAFALAMWGRNL